MTRTEKGVVRKVWHDSDKSAGRAADGEGERRIRLEVV